MTTITVPQSMQAWRVHNFGENPVEVLQRDDIPTPSPDAGELLVKVHGIPLNLNDLERINGRNMMVRPDLPYSPGMEVMGVVVKGGQGVEDWQGRRVVAGTKQAIGGYAEYAVCPAASAFDMPESVAMPDAAALYFPFHLAWLGLYDRAELKSGETVLIHAAAGGAGSAAVQLAKLRGARVIATVGSDAKIELCKTLGADKVVNYSTEDFLPAVMEVTDGKGVDVVFDNVGEAVMENSLKATAYNGRYIMNGFASDKSYVDQKMIVPRSLSAGNLKLCGVLLAYGDPQTRAMMKQFTGWNFVPSEVGQRITREVVAGVQAGSLRAVVGKVVNFAQLPEAVLAMANRETVGRTICQLDT